ncbi:MAG: hypothetical protein KGH57_00270 [Candidatus Micrarchaeota archaeon]|nr:hypothetical protein [Candidatus Micrarchaeota archaeon]
MQEEGKGAGSTRRLRAYLVLTILLVALAAVSFLLVPQGNSVGSCDRLAFQSSRYVCITALALSQGNASVCGYAGSSSDSCYMQVAEKTGNADTCSSISNSTTFSVCVSAIATAREDYALCSSAGEPYASQCAASVAVRLENATLCGSISNTYYRAECSSIIGIRQATLTGNAAYCLNVSSSGNRNLTAYVIANVSAGSAYTQNSFILSSFSFLPNVTYTAKDYCYISLATKFYNPLLCANVSAGEASTLCVAQSSSAYGRNATVNYTALLNACSDAGSFAQQCQESVLLSRAVKTRNVTMCSSLPSSMAVSCFSLMASTYKNATYCGYIANSTANSYCLSNS